MNSAIIVMTLLGCGQTDANCDYIRTVETQFASRAECEARMDAELLKTGSDGYPNVMAVCEPRENKVAAVPDLPGPGPADTGLAGFGEPRVVMAPPEAQRRRPLKQMAEKTGEAMDRLGGKLRSALLKVFRHESRKDEPRLLGEFKGTD